MKQITKEAKKGLLCLLCLDSLVVIRFHVSYAVGFGNGTKFGLMRGIVSMQHVNVTVPDQGLAALFYVSAMGFTRDPYVDFDDWNMWINVGREQFHTKFQSAGLVSAQMPPHEFRFVELRDPNSEEVVWQLEHEVRSLNHPMFGRDLVNRNPANTLFSYTRGRETLASPMEARSD